MPVPQRGWLPTEDAVSNPFRIQYFGPYLDSASRAVSGDGVEVLEYHVGVVLDGQPRESFCPTAEYGFPLVVYLMTLKWPAGHDIHFAIPHVDFIPWYAHQKCPHTARGMFQQRRKSPVCDNMYANECTYPVSTVKTCSLSAINAVRSGRSWQCSHLDSVTMDFVGASDSLKVSLISSE
ncbi:hypothetical protein BJX68DRAFT_103383 [Aspergillus pseudodeflectus]|uniref:Uncharacterized protein n=1 Tax=Aspergillus pseudodeflectus TaxID=176178 RepID=A0ABR4K7H3_9EURO